MQLCGSLSILWHYLSLWLEWKLTFSSPVATAEFSKFSGILSETLSQHHLSGFEIAQLEFHTSSLFVVMLPKAHLTLLSRMSGSRWVITPSWWSGIRMAIIKQSTNNKCRRGCREKQTLLHSWWECKLIKSLWRISMEIPLKIRNKTTMCVHMC